MKFLFFPIIFTFVYNISTAQIGGLSASKLGSLTSTTVDYKKIEFEPSFYYSRSKQYWNSEGNPENLYSTADSISALSGMYFRFTYGVLENMECGITVSSELSICNFGVRYNFLRKPKFEVAAIGGANIPMGTRDIDLRIKATNNIAQVGLGVVTTYSFNEDFSLDFMSQFMRFTKETVTHDKGAYYLNMDLGYYILDHQLQFVGAMAYQFVRDEVGGHQLFTLNPGVTIETGEKFIAVVSFPFGVYGKREIKNTAVNFALTLLFD